ncbi:MAG: head GIN domain-containing protein [Pyrinomonadaceae bacterium]
MKKIGIIIFAVAALIGIGVAGFFSLGRVGERVFNNSFTSRVVGSGTTAIENRDIEEFDSIDVGGVFHVEVTAQKDFHIAIEADDNLLPLIRTEVSGGVLSIESEGDLKPSGPIRVRVSAPNIAKLDVTGASTVSIVNLSNDSLSVNASGASSVSANGVSRSLVVEVSGASRIDLSSLQTEEADVNASGASWVDVSVSEDLRAESSGAGKIQYQGNPGKLSKSASGAGSVSQK